MTPQQTSRREQNKLDTRRAIAQAALDLARSEGLGAFTAEHIAERANISRRTFFNYFHSAEEALSVSTEAFLDQAEAELAKRPADEPILDAMIQALAATTKVENLQDCGDLFRMAAGNPDLLGTQLLAWERAEARIISAVEERLEGQASSLYIHALVGSLLSCAKAAMREWASSENPDHDAAQTLENHIVTTLTMLRDGFSHPTL
ncbi:TetR/AcrR family transcriptional regulator [Arthrobacter sp.]|uniref:TetR/AcrR family transcriptional regulator n=1 Tax=Arthrobacter sp. TaxID=1667 RepID=UPI00281285B5|nr:TetR/AcrR family transcriptional regulator [Arthrobacter sp.]